MPYVIKKSTSQVTNTLKKGNFSFGFSSEDYGPTSTTGLYTGVDIPENGYVVYVENADNPPSAYTFSDDNDLIAWVNSEQGGSVTNISGALNFIAGRTNLLVLDQYPKNIVTDGLILYYDSDLSTSYPRTGTSWKDLSGNGNDATINNGTFANGTFESVFDEDYLGGADKLAMTTPHSTTLNDAFSVTSGGWMIEEWVRVNDLTYPEASAGSVVSGNAYTAGGVGFDWNHGNSSGIGRIAMGVGNNVGESSGYDHKINMDLSSDHSQFNRWYCRHLYWNRDNDTMGVYYNGIFQDSASNANVSGQTLYDGGGILWGSLYGWTHDGSRAGMKVYNKILTEDQLKQNFYGGKTPTDDLLFYLDAGNIASSNNGDGSYWNDISGNAHHFLKYGTPNLTVIDGTKCFSLESDGDRFLLNVNSNFQNLTATTLEAWIRPASGEITSGDRGTIIQGNIYMSWNKSNRRLSSYWYGTDNQGYHEPTLQLEREKWHHLVTVWDGTHLYQYINGNLEKTVTTNINSGAGMTNLKIGRENSARQFSGALSVVKGYSRALTNAEVQSLYSSFETRHKR